MKPLHAAHVATFTLSLLFLWGCGGSAPREPDATGPASEPLAGYDDSGIVLKDKVDASTTEDIDLEHKGLDGYEYKAEDLDGGAGVLQGDVSHDTSA